MKTIKDIDFEQLIFEQHEAVKLKGFHEVKQDERQLLVMVIGEISECVESIRKEKITCDYKNFNNLIIDVDFKTAYEQEIKGTLPEELADVILRICDFVGSKSTRTKYKKIGEFAEKEYTQLERIEIKNVPGYLFNVIRTIQDIFYTSQVKERSAQVIAEIFYLAEVMKIDLVDHIRLKMKYNETREYKFGKQF